MRQHMWGGDIGAVPQRGQKLKVQQAHQMIRGHTLPFGVQHARRLDQP